VTSPKIFVLSICTAMAVREGAKRKEAALVDGNTTQK